MNTYLENSVNEVGWMKRIFFYSLYYCVILIVCNDSVFIDYLCENSKIGR